MDRSSLTSIDGAVRYLGGLRGDRDFGLNWSITDLEDTVVRARRVRLTVRDTIGLVALVVILLTCVVQSERLGWKTEIGVSLSHG